MADTSVSETAGDAIFLEMAAHIGRRLCAAAEWADGRCNWTGLQPVMVPGGARHLPQLLGPELYSGAAGNALFLCRLSRLVDDDAIRATAEGAAEQALGTLEAVADPARASFFAGWTGVAYAVLELGERWGGEWGARGLTLLRRVEELDPGNQAPDALLGTAGAIPALLDVYRRYPEPWIATLAARLGDDLLARARRRAEGWSWPPFGPLSEYHRDDLTGFAHGASGVAWPLLELAVFTGEARYHEAAREGFRYERNWYVPEQANWLDLRYVPGPDGDLNDGTTCQIQWCHGAAGIGLTRVRAWQLLGDPAYRGEAEAALRTVAGDLRRYPHNWQPNFSLCHGVAGNCDLLIEGSAILGDSGLLALAEEFGRTGIERFGRTGVPWPGSLSEAEIPALMTGVAGTGYFYLRLHDPAGFPSILRPVPFS